MIVIYQLVNGEMLVFEKDNDRRYEWGTVTKPCRIVGIQQGGEIRLALQPYMWDLGKDDKVLINFANVISYTEANKGICELYKQMISPIVLPPGLTS